MGTFAKLDGNNVVIQVDSLSNKNILNADGVEEEAVGIAFLNKIHGATYNWIQTSYNTNAGVHDLGGTPFRKNHAGIGYTYDSVRDAFIPIKPYPSWTLNEDTCQWDAPTPIPNDSKIYTWNEDTTSWDLQE